MLDDVHVLIREGKALPFRWVGFRGLAELGVVGGSVGLCDRNMPSFKYGAIGVRGEVEKGCLCVCMSVKLHWGFPGLAGRLPPDP
jgi:hypothetical protein